MRRYLFLIPLLSCLLFPLPSMGDTDSFTSLVFNPTPGRGPYLTLSDTAVSQPLNFNVGLIIDYARTPFKANLGGITRSVNKRMLTGHFLFDINATKFLQVGFDFPVVFFNQFYNPVAPFARDDEFDLGDPLLMVKGEILDPMEKPIGLALVPYVTFPLGNGRTFTGTNNVVPGVKIVAEKKWNKASLALNLGYVFQPDITRAGINIDDMFTYGLGTAINLPWDLVLIGEFEGRTVAKDFFSTEAQSPAQILVALRKKFPRGLSAEVGGAAGLLRGVGSPLARGFLGVSCTEECFGRKASPDRDGDGVPDAQDQCPDVAGPASNNGCPESDIQVKEDKIETPTIYFNTGKATIKPEGKAVLDRLVAAVKARPGIKGLKIEGHTDNIGGHAYNLNLSKRRAASVKGYLESQGIGIPLESEGYSFDKPIADNTTPAGRSKNRRVEFLIAN